MKREYFKGAPITAPNTVLYLDEVDFYVSYNSVDRAVYGSDTTALVRTEKGNPVHFLILDGNHTKAYKELGTYKACVEYFKAHVDLKNQFSDDV